MRKILIALAALAGFAWTPVSAQVSANLPVTCSPTTADQCVRATPVVNPDGTNIGGGGGSGPTTVVGNTASGTADSGAPVKIGGLVNTTTPSVRCKVTSSTNTGFTGMTCAQASGSIVLGGLVEITTGLTPGTVFALSLPSTQANR